MNEAETDVRWAEVVALVDEQADDEGLWFIAQTAPEAYLQQELRRLHAAIERAGMSTDGESRSGSKDGVRDRLT